jgi:hypothetical protein
MNIKDFIEVVSAVGTLILSLVALVFSIYAYKRVSLSGDFKRKQLDTVYELIEVLQDTIIMVEVFGTHDSPNVSSGSMFRFFRLERSQDFHKEYKNTDAFFISKPDAEQEFSFIKFSEHPYMVPEIAEIIREFIAYAYEPSETIAYSTYTVLGGGYAIMKHPIYRITDNQVYKSFGTFCVKCAELDDAIHRWLRSVGIKNFNKKATID